MHLWPLRGGSPVSLVTSLGAVKAWKLDYVAYVTLSCELVGLWCNSISTLEGVGTWYSLGKVGLHIVRWKVTRTTVQKRITTTCLFRFLVRTQELCTSWNVCVLILKTTNKILIMKGKKEQRVNISPEDMFLLTWKTGEVGGRNIDVREKQTLLVIRNANQQDTFWWSAKRFDNKILSKSIGISKLTI